MDGPDSSVRNNSLETIMIDYTVAILIIVWTLAFFAWARGLFRMDMSPLPYQEAPRSLSTITITGESTDLHVCEIVDDRCLSCGAIQGVRTDPFTYRESDDKPLSRRETKRRRNPKQQHSTKRRRL